MSVKRVRDNPRQCSLKFFKVYVRIKFLLSNNIILGLICIYDDVQEICAKPFLKGHFCALQVFLCALISRSVCVRIRAQLRGNNRSAKDSPFQSEGPTTE